MAQPAAEKEPSKALLKDSKDAIASIPAYVELVRMQLPRPKKIDSK